MSARGFLGAGDLYISLYSGGTWGPRQGPFEVKKFEIKPNSELKEMTSKGRSTYGQVLESVPVPKPFELSVELAEVNTTSMAIALFGTSAALTQTSGTLTEEAVTFTALDVWYPLTKANLTGSQTVTNTAGSTTYVNGVDYLINKQLGWIKALPGGAISAGGIAEITSTYAAITGTQIKGATNNQVRARFTLDGKNFADDLPAIVTVHEAVMNAESAFDFLADDFNTVAMTGRMKTPTGFTEPFTVDLRNA